jgi:hypothetical protein
MTWRPPFTPAEIEYARNHLDEWPSVLAYKMTQLFGIPRTRKGVRDLQARLKEESVKSVKTKT